MEEIKLDRNELVRNQNIQYETPRGFQSPGSSDVIGGQHYNFQIVAKDLELDSRNVPI